MTTEESKAVETLKRTLPYDSDFAEAKIIAIRAIQNASSAEPLTDAEQRIFLKAMGREEEVCKIVDEEWKDEGYKLNLVHACQEIVRKVKGALWT